MTARALLLLLLNNFPINDDPHGSGTGDVRSINVGVKPVSPAIRIVGGRFR